MAKNIIMQVLTSAGYEPMYPFNPAQILNATFLSTSTATQYNLSITGAPTPFTNTFANQIGLVAFIPTINNGANPKISINGSSSYPILAADGTAIPNNTLIANRPVFVKYLKNSFYLTVDKNQIGLGNVSNTSDENKPISIAVQNALNNKISVPTQIPRGANLNSYTTPGFYYNPNNSDVSTMTNVPEKVAFSLLVEKHAGTKQTFTVYTPGTGMKTYVRNYFSGSWGSWVQQAFVLSGTSAPSSNLGFNGNIYLKYQ